LPVRLANDGSSAWSLPPLTPDDRPGGVFRPAPLLVGRWIPLSAGVSMLPDPVEEATPVVAPGNEAVVGLELTAPGEPGTYLLVIDLVIPIHGSMAAAGVPAAQVIVTVGAPSTAAPSGT
ncbi:MAG TPA: hypothetical protein VEG29_03440, partial [Candidatus Binatia bacterium]|nr:hypothetical protein [Candidatus Binatia bacterium]